MTDGFTSDQEYNVKDCCGTLELRDVLLPQLDESRARTYRLSLALQAPILDMTLRGVRIDREHLGEEKVRLSEEISTISQRLFFVASSITDRPYNPGSWQQLRYFLFDCLGETPVHAIRRNERVVSTDRDSLEKMREKSPLLAPFIDLQLHWRDQTKLLQFLNTGLDPDGRIRSFFSIGGTVTGRLSSSENAFGGGGNLQNITEDLRYLFISDPGYLMVNVDLAQADSWNVALETFQATGDRAYLDAILSGDLHTYVTRMVWPNLPWTGDLHRDREIAERPFYRHHDYRFMSKKAGHGSNYLGKPGALAHQMHIPFAMAAEFQDKYFEPFWAIRKWQQIRTKELQLTKALTTVLGRKRRFHGRLNDRETWKEAIAYLGQSPTADSINYITLALHRALPEVQLLLQVHDSLLMQVPVSRANDLIPEISRLFSVPITVSAPNGTTITHAIPSDISVGWNWGKRWKKLPDGSKIEAQPDGLDSWRGSLDRQRRYDPSMPLLDRVLS